MRWIVDGADRESGEERTVSVDSGTRAGAEEEAGRLGLLIGAVRAAQPHELPPLEELASDPDGDNEALAVLAEEWAGPPRTAMPTATPGGEDRGWKVEDSEGPREYAGVDAPAPEIAAEPSSIVHPSSSPPRLVRRRPRGQRLAGTAWMLRLLAIVSCVCGIGLGIGVKAQLAQHVAGRDLTAILVTLGPASGCAAVTVVLLALAEIAAGLRDLLKTIEHPTSK